MDLKIVMGIADLWPLVAWAAVLSLLLGSALYAVTRRTCRHCGDDTDG